MALGFMVAVFQAKKRRELLTLQMTAAFLFFVHFLLLGAVTGAIMNLIGGLRSLTFLKLSKKRDWRIPLIFIGLYMVATFVFWQGTKSLLPLLGMTFGTIAFWQIKPARTRRLTLLASPPWLIYSVISGSYPGVLVEMLVLSSNVVGIYRLDLPRKRVK